MLPARFTRLLMDYGRSIMDPEMGSAFSEDIFLTLVEMYGDLYDKAALFRGMMMAEYEGFTPEDVHVCQFIADKMGLDSWRRRVLVFDAERQDYVLETARIYRARVVEVEYYERGARRYQFWHRPPPKRTAPVGDGPGLRIIKPWEDDFEEDPNFIPSNN